MSPTVTKIPATRALHTGKPLSATALKRVAGYARVSTDNEDQVSSYQAQVDYYTTYITDHPGWELVKVYTDEGITGTSTAKRAGFQTMVADALAGKIDLIVTKSVSRFARNTVDSLTTVRKLKDKGVEVYFQRENIWTLDSKGELLITIMSSLAQEEARSISENVTWGHRKRFADGKVTMPFGSFLGYDRGEDGQPVINEEQAKTVREIYSLFLEGKSLREIARILTERGRLTARGKTQWSRTAVRSILTNERYKGDALLQKTYTKDFLTKELVKNNGEVPQYYVTGSHEAIIDPLVWDFVQTQLAQSKGRRSRKHVLSHSIVCGQCGAFFTPKTWHAGTKNEKRIWRCSAKYEQHTHCTTRHYTTDQIEKAFETALATMLHANGKDPLTLVEQVSADLFDTSGLEAEVEIAWAVLNAASQALADLVEKGANATLTAGEYDQKYAAATCAYDQAQAKHSQLQEQVNEIRERKTRYDFYRRSLTDLTQEQVTFTPLLFHTLIDHATAQPDGQICFTFRDGQTVTPQID
ncbi:recombinase family protein [Boudabousia liubingyangii]|uniref:Recombinase family protein n=2 Tax=Boudabousia TaxID=2767318 RepID=A0A1D9MLG1_9ACTO|nr:MULTISPECIES: recombinase family protein [Boudabousia]AOZ73068.1 recombinase family protein [Boudabousia tangfeifanii]OKL48857.1 recombinase family protein [Boudabousia liubingyangii]